MEPAVWAVAGCLFEVHVPRPQGDGHVQWAESGAPVTLLAAHLPDEPADECRFRFRAERPGVAELAFDRSGVTVHIAPERIPGGAGG